MEHNRQASDGTTYDNGYGIFLISEDIFEHVVWASSDTNGGYMNSEIHKRLNGPCYKSMNIVLNNHLIQRDVLLSNSINGYSSNSYQWTKAYMTLMSVGQVTGIFAQNNNKFDDGEANYALPLSNFISISPISGWGWLRGIYNNKKAWNCIGDNISNNNVFATGGIGSFPLMMIR